MGDRRTKRHIDSPEEIRKLHRQKLKQAKPFKREVYFALENLHLANIPAKIGGVFLFVLIVVNAVVVFISTQPGLDPFTANLLNGFYAFTTVCFGIEYCLRIWVANIAYADLRPARARWRYMHSIMGIIDFFAFFPSMVAWFLPVTSALINTINLLRLVRLVKISRYMRGLVTIGQVFEKRKSEIVASFLVILLLIVVAGVLMYEAEHEAQPNKFSTVFTSLYWAVETVTAVGYGDLVPITFWGRLIGSVIMLLSLALIAIPGGIFSAGFVAEFRSRDAQDAAGAFGILDFADNKLNIEGEGIMGQRDYGDYSDTYDDSDFIAEDETDDDTDDAVTSNVGSSNPSASDTHADNGTSNADSTAQTNADNSTQSNTQQLKTQVATSKGAVDASGALSGQKPADEPSQTRIQDDESSQTQKRDQVLQDEAQQEFQNQELQDEEQQEFQDQEEQDEADEDTGEDVENAGPPKPPDEDDDNGSLNEGEDVENAL